MSGLLETRTAENLHQADVCGYADAESVICIYVCLEISSTVIVYHLHNHDL